MIKRCFLILLAFLMTFPILDIQLIRSEERWKEVATFKSGVNFVQYFVSKPFLIKSKIWKIRYEAIIGNPDRRAYIQIDCLREYGNKEYFEAILPRQDCVYYFYDEEIIYGWQLGYEDYKVNVISENMDWTVTVFEYYDTEYRPSLSVTKELVISPKPDECEDYVDKVYSEQFEFTTENGIFGIRLKKVEKTITKNPPSLPRRFSYSFNIDCNKGVGYPSGFEKGFLIHTKPGATITLFTTVLNCIVTYEIYIPEPVEKD